MRAFPASVRFLAAASALAACGYDDRPLASKLGNVVSVLDFGAGAGAPQTAIDAIGANGTVVFPAGYAVTLTSGLTISNSGVTLWLEQGATITKGFNGILLQATGTDVTINGGVWDGNKAGGFTGHVFQLYGNNPTVKNAVITNGGDSGIVFWGGAGGGPNECRAEGNRLSGHTNWSIWLDGTTNCTVAGNIIDAGGFSAIGIYGVVAPHNITVVRNVITNGTNGANAFCVEVTAAGVATDISITGNSCRSTGNNLGGYSVGPCTRCSITGNSYDMVTFAGSIAGIELVDTINVTVTGNTLNGGTGLAVGVWLNKGNNGTVVGNTINGFSSGGTGLQIVADGLGSAAAKHNIVSNNGVMFPAIGAGSGITILANDALAHCSQNIIAGNSVTGNGVAATNGIYVLKALGTLTKTFVYGNSLDKLANGINLHSDDATQISGNVFTSTVMTPITTTASTNLQLFNPSRHRFR
jgi:parallel beta-helix repeat protein